MAVRNFWIDIDVDGKATTLSGGPTGKEGGFEQTIYIRRNGGIQAAATIIGRTSGNDLALTFRPEPGMTVLVDPDGTVQIKSER